MKKVITRDKSITYYNEQVEDHYHTLSGAKEEAFEKHAKALGVNSKKNPVIYDICFGLGYNTAATMDIINSKATFYCFENDKEILKKALEIDAEFKSFPIIKEFIKQFFEGNNVYETDNVKLVMVFGDARENIKKVKENADFIFFDPFSPAKVPDMWTKEFFLDIKEKMNKGAKLSTYSYARFVRDNMKSAGLKVEDGPIIGRRSPSTIAVKG